jgi:hypothetical protein
MQLRLSLNEAQRYHVGILGVKSQRRFCAGGFTCAAAWQGLAERVLNLI